MEFLADVDDELDYNEDDLPSSADRLPGPGDRAASHGTYTHAKGLPRRSGGKPSSLSSVSSRTSSPSPREEGEAYSDDDEEPHRHGDAGRRAFRKKSAGDREEGEASSDDEFHHRSAKVRPRKHEESTASLTSNMLSSEEAEAHYRHRLHERYTQRRRGEGMSGNGGAVGSNDTRRGHEVSSKEAAHRDRDKESRKSGKSKKSGEVEFQEPRSVFGAGPIDDRHSPELAKSKGSRLKSDEQSHRDDHKKSRSKSHAKQAADEHQLPQHYETSSRSAVVHEAVRRSYSTSYLTVEKVEERHQEDSGEVYYSGKAKRSQVTKITTDPDGQFDDQEKRDSHYRSKKSKRDRRDKGEEEEEDSKNQSSTENDLRRFLLSQQQQQQQQQQYSKHRPASMTRLDEYASWDSSQSFSKYRVAAVRGPAKRKSPSPLSPNPSPGRLAGSPSGSSGSSSPQRRPQPRYTSSTEEGVGSYTRRPKEDTERDYRQHKSSSRGSRDNQRTMEDDYGDDDGGGAAEAKKRARRYAGGTSKHKLSSDSRSGYPVPEKHGRYSDNIYSASEESTRIDRRIKPSPSPTTTLGPDGKAGGVNKLDYDDSRDHGRPDNSRHRPRQLKRSPFPADEHFSGSSSGSADYAAAARSNGQSFDKEADEDDDLETSDALGDSAVKQSPPLVDGEEVVGESGEPEKDPMEVVTEAVVKPTRPLSYTRPAHLFSESESDDDMSGPELLPHAGTVEDILLQPRQAAADLGSGDDQVEGDTLPVSAVSPPQRMMYPSKPFYYPSIQGCRSVEEFECLNRIEEGTYGVVYRARDRKINEIVALKRLKMEKERDGFPITSLREINTLMKAQHENIVTVREIVVGSNMDKIYLVMDYVEHDMKSLMEIMNGPFSVGEVKCLLVQLLRAVRHLHDNWILHRDLKTSNLLLSHQGILKVGDFGLAREYGSPLKHYTEVVVTLWYRAPELLLGVKQYTCPIDLWSVGCIFAEFLLQRPLFPGKGEVDELNIIFRDLGTPTERIWPGVSQLPGMKKCVFTDYPYNQLRRRFTEKQISDQGFDLLNNFLTYCPDRRITADKALSHAYFTERPRAIHHSMFPSWPAKSEGGVVRKSSPRRPAGGGALAAAAAASASATGDTGGRVRYQPPAPPMGGQRFYSSMGADSRPGTAVGSGPDSVTTTSGADRGFLLRF